MKEFKSENKKELCKLFNLEYNEDVPLIGMVTRLDEQKGISLLIEAADQLFGENVQMVMLADGDLELKKQMRLIQKTHHSKFNVKFGFDEELAHQIEAGSDMFLIPSQWEPCGLSAMYSQVYGSVPIVHATGGLVDIVHGYENKTKTGNGFVFKNYKSDDMLKTIKKAVETYHDKDHWMDIVTKCMSMDWTWKESVQKYDDIYRKLVKE